MKIVYNIGYNSKTLGSSGVLTYCPIIFNGDFEQFKNALRCEEGIKCLFSWAEDNHVTPSSMAIFMSIEEDDKDNNEEMFAWEFCLHMINVREYRIEWEKKYNTPWKHGTYIKLK